MLLPPAAQPVLLAAMLLFGLYMAYEVVRWLRGNQSELTRGQFQRRVVGGLLLELDLALWYLANPLLAGRPASQKLLYLLAAMLFVLLPMLLAVREAFFVLRQYSRWRGEALRGIARGERSGRNGSG